MMEHEEVVRIVLQAFKLKEEKAVLTFKELMVALSMEKEPKVAKKHLSKMVEDGLLRWHHADTVYYELVR